jgi:tetratricopeptide (TPR) repeat protein
MMKKFLVLLLIFPFTAAFAQEGDPEIACLTEVIRQNPDSAWAYLNRGDVYYAKGDADRAIADYDQAFRLDPVYASELGRALDLRGGSAYLGNGGRDRAARRNRFIDEGFGFHYDADEMEDIDLFIARHGKPPHMYETDLENRGDTIVDKTITLEYPAVTVEFNKWQIRGSNEYRSLCFSIISKDGVTYLYDIKHGLPLQELENIIGKIYFKGDDAFVFLTSGQSHSVQISFFEGKIESIKWYYLLQ